MSVWSAFFDFLFAQNLVTQKFMGLSGLSHLSGLRFSRVLLSTLALSVVIFLAVAVSSVIYLGLDQFGWKSFHFYTLIIPFLGVVALVQWGATRNFLKGILPSPEELVLNTLFFGALLLFVPQNGDVAVTLAQTGGALLGFLLVKILLWGMMKRWHQTSLPTFLRGWPIVLIFLGFLSLIFVGILSVIPAGSLDGSR